MAEESINDRVAAQIFGDEPEKPVVDVQEVDQQPDETPVEATAEETDQTEESVEASADEGEEQPEFVEVEIDGKLYEVPNEIKDSILRNSDYTQKTQKLAEERKAIEIMRTQAEQSNAQRVFAESIRDELTEAYQLEQTATQLREYMGQNLDNLSSTDIEKIRFQIEEAKTKREQIQQALGTKYTEFQQAQEQTTKELLAKSTEVLKAKIPGWGVDLEKKVATYAIEQGIPAERLSQVTDPLEVQLLYKAMQYDTLQQGKVAAVKKATSTPTIKPKARNPMPDDVKRKLNFNKQMKQTGLSDKDKSKLIQNRIADKLGL